MFNCIYIVDPKKYELITTIVDEEYISDCGTLCASSKDSFIYVPYDGGCLCKVTIVNGEYKITSKIKINENNLLRSVCMVNDGKYIIGSNKYNGCSIFN